MALKRILPCLLYNGKGLVKTIQFKNPGYVGDPINAIKIFNEKEVDELVVLDINATKEQRGPNFSKIADMAGEAFMPFAYGGGVKTYEDFVQLFKLGIEKVIVNTLLFESPETVKRVVDSYGAQAVVASVDYRKPMFGPKVPFNYAGKKIKHDLSSFVSYVEKELGVGEILLQSADRDGTWEGYDYEVISKVVAASSLPVIAAGGCGNQDHLKKVLYECNVNAAAIGSMAVYSKKGMGVLINFPVREHIIKE
mgnify:CR=1 FL=1